MVIIHHTATHSTAQQTAQEIEQTGGTVLEIKADIVNE